MIIALVLFENGFLNIVAISFTALILNELIMVALEITSWYVCPASFGALIRTLGSPRHLYMIISEVVTLVIYAFSMIFLPEYFGGCLLPSLPFVSVSPRFAHSHTLPDLSFVVSVRFGWKVAVIVAISALPLWIIKVIKSCIAPEATTKL
jgi:phospholipid-translocating ATPase